MARRRTRGTGSITWDKSRRRWIARFRSEKLLKKTFTTKSGAERWLNSILSDQRENIALITPTVASWMQIYLADLSIKPSTAQLYLTINKDRITPFLGSVKLSELTASHINRWLKRLETKYAYTSTRNAYRLLSQALKEAVNRELIRKNPCTVKLRSNTPPQPSVALNQEEATRFLEAAKEYRLYPLFLLALSSGMRVGELLALRWDNVDIDNKLIYVRETIRVIKREAIVTSPKTRSSIRSIPIDESVLTILLEHQKTMKHESINWKGNRIDLVFPSRNGTVILHNILIRTFKAILKRAGLKTIRFHDLRHTAASLMLANQTNILDVSRILGHSSTAITMSIYAHSYEQSQRSAISGLSNVLLGGNNDE